MDVIEDLYIEEDVLKEKVSEKSYFTDVIEGKVCLVFDQVFILGLANILRDVFIDVLVKVIALKLQNIDIIVYLTKIKDVLQTYEDYAFNERHDGMVNRQKVGRSV